jgi:hypothetical protein
MRVVDKANKDIICRIFILVIIFITSIVHQTYH